MPHRRFFLAVAGSTLAAVLPLAAAAAEGVPQSQPGPMPARPMGPPPGMGTPPRPMPGLEVELLVVEPATQAKSLARWAVLAAEGYRLSQVGVSGTTQYLYLERMITQPGSVPALPSQVETEPGLAAETRSRIIAAQEARRPRPSGDQPSFVRPAPAPTPIPAPAPVAPAPATAQPTETPAAKP